MISRIVAGLACLFLLAGCARQTDEAFERRLHAYLLAHPEVIQEAAIKLREKQAKAAAHVLKNAQARLERDPRDLVANPDGVVTVVEFFDYRCAYCKAAAPDVAKLIKDNPDVRFVFKQYPVFGSVSDAAARMALTPQGKDKGLALHESLMGQKALTDVRLDAVIGQLGLDPGAVREAARDPAIDAQIRDARALAQEIRITGTPTFILGGEVIAGADMARLRGAILRARGEALGALAGP